MRNRHDAYIASLPSAWERRRIDSLGTVYGGSTPSRAAPHYWGGDIPWVAPGELTGLRTKYLRETKERITPTGLASCGATVLPRDALLVTSRATLGALALVQEPTATNQGFKSVVFAGEADPHFYYHLFKRLGPELERRASGTTFLEIPAREFNAVVVPLPSLSEQRRISAILDTLDYLIRKTEQVIAKLKQVKQGLLHDLLTRGIDENGELRDPERHPEQFKDSPLGRIPKAWKVVRLGDALNGAGGFIQTGPFGSQLHAYEYVLDGVPVVMPQNMAGGRINMRGIATISPARADQLRRHRVQRNDVLVARRGDVQRCAAVSEREIGWVCGTGCLLARVPATVFNSDWLSALYRQPVIQRQVLGMAVGTTMINLNTSVLSRLLVVRPPASEQVAVAATVRTLDSRLTSEQEELEKLAVLRSGLMEDLLTGRVRTAELDPSLFSEAAP